MEFRIDRQKWLDAVRDVKRRRELYKEFIKRNHGKTWQELAPIWVQMRKETGTSCDLSLFERQLTKLYAIRAMARGRLHLKRMRVDWGLASMMKIVDGYSSGPRFGEFVAAGGSLLMDLTYEQQANYVGDDWKPFLRNPPAEVMTNSTTVTVVIG